MMTLAIAIPCLNSARTLEQTLISLITARVFETVNIYLLDGGSTDDTRIIANKYNFLHGGAVEFIDYTGIHPAHRVNLFLEDTCPKYTFLCHSDDIYNPRAMINMAKILDRSDLWALGAQCTYFLDPLEAKTFNVKAYRGVHLTHPTRIDQLFCELPFWWATSTNTLLVKAKELTSNNLFFDYQKYSYCNDYDFCFRLSQLKKLRNVSFPSVFTRHRSSSDGGINLNLVKEETSLIRSKIRDTTGLNHFLGRHLQSVLKSIDYQYGRWNSAHENLQFAINEYYLLSQCLKEFSYTSNRYTHYKNLASKLNRFVIKYVVKKQISELTGFYD